MSSSEAIDPANKRSDAFSAAIPWFTPPATARAMSSIKSPIPKGTMASNPLNASPKPPSK